MTLAVRNFLLILIGTFLVTAAAAQDFQRNAQIIADLALGSTPAMLRDALGAPVALSRACGTVDIADFKQRIRSFDDLANVQMPSSFDEMFADIDKRAETPSINWEMWAYAASPTRVALIIFRNGVYADHLLLDYPGGIPARMPTLEIRDRQMQSFADLTDLPLGSSYRDARRLWKPTIEARTPLELYQFFRAAGSGFSEHVSTQTYAAMANAHLAVYIIGDSVSQYLYYKDKLIGFAQVRTPSKHRSPDDLRRKY